MADDWPIGDDAPSAGDADLWTWTDDQMVDWIGRLRCHCICLRCALAAHDCGTTACMPPDGNPEETGSDGLTSSEREAAARCYAETVGAPLTAEDIARIKSYENIHKARSQENSGQA
jgi:hypothetical protein